MLNFDPCNLFDNVPIQSKNKSMWNCNTNGSRESKVATSLLGGGRAYKPKAFSEKGLYMLATILKSSIATQVTIAIVGTFAKVREANHAIVEILNEED